MKKKSNANEGATYVAPIIEVYDIVLEQSVLQGGSTQDMPGEVW